MKTIIILFGLLWISAHTPFAQESAHTRVNSKQVAIDGYDPVSYFQQKPVKGSKSYEINHQGIIYQFSTPSNAAAFQKNPVKYIPQYGGWCAFAMADNGEKVSIDPLNYQITDGKLYLFYKNLVYNSIHGWRKNEAEQIKKADQNWSVILSQKTPK